MGSCDAFFSWFVSLQPPSAEPTLTATAFLDRILKPYAKQLSDRGAYYIFACPRAYPHGSHASEEQEANPSCVSYKTSVFATDFHLESSDPNFNIPPFPLWCLLKYGAFDVNTDRSRYPEFCDEIGITRTDFQLASDLIVAWASLKFQFLFKEKWQMYSDVRGEHMTAGIFLQSFDDGILDTLRVSARECNPPVARKRYAQDQMPNFFKSWAPSAFHRLWDATPIREDLDVRKLPNTDREMFVFHLRGLFTKQVLFSFKGASKPFATSLIALASDLDLSEEWQAIEDYPVFFRKEKTEESVDLLIGLTYDLVCQFHSEWAKTFRSSKQFSRYVTDLDLGKSQTIYINRNQRRVMIIAASKLDLELRGPSVAVQAALEDIGEGIEEERFTK